MNSTLNGFPWDEATRDERMREERAQGQYAPLALDQLVLTGLARVKITVDTELGVAYQLAKVNNRFQEAAKHLHAAAQAITLLAQQIEAAPFDPHA